MQYVIKAIYRTGYPPYDLPYTQYVITESLDSAKRNARDMHLRMTNNVFVTNIDQILISTLEQDAVNLSTQQMEEEMIPFMVFKYMRFHPVYLEQSL